MVAMTSAFYTTRLLTTLLLVAVTARSQNTTGPGSCPGIMDCMQQRSGMDDCRWGALGVCIAGLESTCQFKQGAMTTKQVLAKFQDFCREISMAANASQGEVACQTMGQCVVTSDLMVKFKASASDVPALEDLMLDTSTWCQYLKMVSGCYVKTSSNCTVNAHLLSYMTKQHTDLQTACNGAPAVLGSWMLSVLLVALAYGTKLFA